MTDKTANTDHPIHELLMQRWSPVAFDSRPIDEADLLSIFEAARWAPSSYNEQPWNYILARQSEPAEFQKLLSCLVEANQKWARFAPVLVLGVISQRFSRNGNENRAASHDLGLAAGNLVLEATARGLFVHQMIGLYPDKAREIYSIPEGYEALTALAIGHRADPSGVSDDLRQREDKARERKPLNEFVYAGQWARPSPIVIREN